MSLIELKDIGKIYVSENSVAVGIRGVNVKLDIGEFVAITGASGSGKTTLLNVLSGIDTYEEGEMFVCGEPTSHYIQTDWEEYREKYISFIFQDYNILESFTVLQNVELALTHIKSKKERRKRAEYLIEKVGLSAHKDHKGSKLSGGQKQRTVIARALAKDSPIILADEPTGNLDSHSALEIIELLREISAEKLVVVVTHSFDEVKDAATREIRIFDGAIERDTEMRPANKLDPNESIPKYTESMEKKKFAFLHDGFELGVHRFFAKPKLAVLMSVIMTFAILSTFYITAYLIGTQNLFGTSYVFTPMDGRVSVTRVDGKPIGEEEIKKLADKYDANSYLGFDGTLDTFISINRPNKENRYFSLKYKYGLDGCKPEVGRLPNKGEVYLRLPISMKPYYGDSKLLIDTVRADNGTVYKVSGVEYFYDNSKTPEMAVRTEDFAEMTANGFFASTSGDYNIICEVRYSDGQMMEHYDGQIVVDGNLQGNEVFFFGGIENSLNPSISNIMIDMYVGSFMESNTVYSFDVQYNTKKGMEYEKLSESSGWYNGWGLHVSPELAAQIIEEALAKVYPQGSLFFDNDRIAKKVCEEIKEDEYFALTTDVSYVNVSEKIIAVIQAVFLIAVWLVAIIFIAFFLSLCIARNIDTLRVDIGILRSMGIKNNAIKMSMYSIVSLAMIPAFIIFAAAAIFIYATPQLNPILPFLHAPHYILITLGTIIIGVRLAGRNNKRIFRQSVRKTLKGGND